jgi:hypothetical protein
VFKLSAHAVETRRQQRFLVPEMTLEGRAADIGSVEDVLDCGFLVALFEHKFQERVVQQLAGASHAPIADRGAGTRWFPYISASVFDTGHLASTGR